MKGNYEPDKFTENDVLAALDQAGLKHGRGGGRYILSQCPLHEDKHESAQIYTDDWFVKCHAGCEGGRFHITKAFPELRRQNNGSSTRDRFRGSQRNNSVQSGAKKVSETKYKDATGEIMRMWESLPPIPEGHQLKLGMPADQLNEHGWRWDAKHERYLIPYFSRSKTSIPFAQWRNLKGNVRFNFWKDAKPTIYGTWNLAPGDTLFLVEGTSDAMVLDYCAIPWIAAPSAASGELVKLMAGWCSENNVKLVYAGDNDPAGDKLRDALDEVTSYRVRQPRHPYKDWGEMFEAEGQKSVINYCHQELYPGEEVPFPEIEPGYKKPEEAPRPEGWEKMSDVEKVQAIIPGSVELKIVGGDDRKKQSKLPSPSSPLPF